MQVKNFTRWISESKAPTPYTRKLSELNPQRKYLGDTYNTDLFLRFKQLSNIREKHGKRIGVERWFELAQIEDKAFYAAVLADEMGQPDVRELWRDLMGRNASKVKGQVIFKDPFKDRESQDNEVRDLVTESAEDPIIKKSELDPSWNVVITYPNDVFYSSAQAFFDKFGIAFANLAEQVIYIDGAEVSEDYFTENHLLAIEAHEIGHKIAEHQGEPYYSEKQEMEADWVGINLLMEQKRDSAAALLAQRFLEAYNIEHSKFTKDLNLTKKLNKYLNKI